MGSSEQLKGKPQAQSVKRKRRRLASTSKYQTRPARQALFSWKKKTGTSRRPRLRLQVPGNPLKD